MKTIWLSSLEGWELGRGRSHMEVKFFIFNLKPFSLFVLSSDRTQRNMRLAFLLWLVPRSIMEIYLHASIHIYGTVFRHRNKFTIIFYPTPTFLLYFFPCITQQPRETTELCIIPTQCIPIFHHTYHCLFYKTCSKKGPFCNIITLSTGTRTYFLLQLQSWTSLHEFKITFMDKNPSVWSYGRHLNGE